MEWISVKDRLPEPGRYVACIAKRNPFSRFMPMVARIEKNGWANPITEQYISEATHWLPMPEPPKEEKRRETQLAEPLKCVRAYQPPMLSR